MSFNFDTFGQTEETGLGQKKSSSGFSFDTFGSKPLINPQEQKDRASSDLYRPNMPYSYRDIQQPVAQAGLTGGLKAAANLPTSFAGLLKGIWDFGVMGAKAIEPGSESQKNLMNIVAAPATKLTQKLIESGTGRKVERINGKYVEVAPGRKVENEQTQTFDAIKNIMIERYGGLDNMNRTAVNDPFGFATDVLVLASGGLGMVGKGELATRGISAIGGPVERGLGKTVGALGTGLKEATTGAAGITTGVGKEAFSQALKGGPEFTAGLRGRTNLTEVLGEAQNGLSQVKQMRADAYQAAMDNLKVLNPQSLDISPVAKKASSLLNDFNVKITESGLDFSRSPLIKDQEKINAVLKTLEDWGTQVGDRTVGGVDTLKRLLRGFREPTNPTLTKFVDDLSREARNVAAEAKGYDAIEKTYGRYSDFIDDLEKTLSLREGASPDTSINKLNSLLRDNADYRRMIADELKALTGKDLISSVAGQSLNKFAPQGLAKYVAGVSAFSMPSIIPYLAVASPRVMGEFFRLVGATGRVVGPMLGDINNFRVGVGLKQIRLPKAVTEELNRIEQFPNRNAGMIKNPFARKTSTPATSLVPGRKISMKERIYGPAPDSITESNKIKIANAEERIARNLLAKKMRGEQIYPDDVSRLAEKQNAELDLYAAKTYGSRQAGSVAESMNNTLTKIMPDKAQTQRIIEKFKELAAKQSVKSSPAVGQTVVTTDEIKRFLSGKTAVPEPVKRLFTQASDYQPEFAKNVESIAKRFGVNFEHGPVKSPGRITEKLLEPSIAGDISKIRDSNRAVLFFDNLQDVYKNIDNVKFELQKNYPVERVKENIGVPGYNRFNINVELPDGRIGEIQLTTPGMWETKLKGGGESLYRVERAPTTPKELVELIKQRGNELYAKDPRSPLSRAAKSANEGGFTMDVVRDIEYAGTPNISVSPFPERTITYKGQTNEQHIADFLEKNADLLLNDGYAIGGWYNKVTGETYLDIAIPIPKSMTKQAINLSKRANQIAAFDLEIFEEISTGGTGKATNIPSFEARKMAVDKLLDKYRKIK